MTTYINELNTAISPFDLDIRSTNTQTSQPTRLYALVNTTSDAITQLATTHTADEIAFVKRLLDAMFETNNTHRSEVMAVSATAALRLAKAQEGEQVASLTMMQAQRCLGALVEEGWLLCSRREFYSLSARALMELRGWLEEAYNDEEEEVVKVRVCHACREIVTVVSISSSCLPCLPSLLYH